MRRHGRGGSLLVVPAGSDAWRESIVRPVPYAVSPVFSELAELVTRPAEERRERGWQDAIAESIDAVAGLTAVDGATVMTDRYDLLAFGAKIARRSGLAQVEQVTLDRADRRRPRGRRASEPDRRHATPVGRAVRPRSARRRRARRLSGRTVHDLRLVPLRGHGPRAPRGGAAPVIAELTPAILHDGYAFLRGDATRHLLAPYGALSDWHAFAESWNHLELDPYMADGGRYRRRRHAVYGAADDGPIARQPHQPHYQALEYNPLHGGIARWFEPIAPEVGDGSSMRTILAFCRSLFGGLAPATRAWRIEVHQFRIEAQPGVEGRPTPEGLHRDGVDYVLVLLVARRNIASGVTTIHALDGRALGSFTLTDPFDAALVDDRRVAHGVTPVDAIDPAAPAYRDVLVVTFAREEKPTTEDTETIGATGSRPTEA